MSLKAENLKSSPFDTKDEYEMSDKHRYYHCCLIHIAVSYCQHTIVFARFDMGHRFWAPPREEIVDKVKCFISFI